MKVGFYIQGSEHLGVEILSGMLKAHGHETEAFFDPRLWADGNWANNKILGRWFRTDEMIVDEIAASDIDLLCFSVVTDTYKHSLEVAQMVKDRLDIPIAFGGVHCTSVPDRVIKMPQIDYVVIGEGEYPLLELCEALEKGVFDKNIDNVWFKARGKVVAGEARPLISDLDTIAFPDKEFFLEKAPSFYKKRYVALSSRGCVYKCTFCNNSMYKDMYNKQKKGKWYRRRTVDNLMEELVAAHKAYGFTHLHFWDEIFVDKREWLREFSEKYSKALGLPFWCYAYSTFIDEEAIGLLEQAGCGEINIGFQTVRNETRKKFLGRGERNKKVEEVVSLCRNSNIYLSTGNILNIPGGSIEEGLELAEFYNKNRVDFPNVGFLRYYPRTEIVNIAVREGILTEQDVEEIEEAKDDRPIYKAHERDSAEYRRIRSLILLTTWVPRPIVRALITKGWWRLIPKSEFVGLLLHWVAILKFPFSKKKHLSENVGLFIYFGLMASYGVKKLKWMFSSRNLSSGTPPTADETTGAQ